MSGLPWTNDSRLVKDAKKPPRDTYFQAMGRAMFDKDQGLLGPERKAPGYSVDGGLYRYARIGNHG